MTTNIWDAERIVDADEARSLINQQFPEIAAEKMEVLGVGWDNTAYLVNDKYVFRFPRRQIAVALLDTEHSALKELSKLLPLQIPQPEWFGKPTENYPWPF